MTTWILILIGIWMQSVLSASSSLAELRQMYAKVSRSQLYKSCWGSKTILHRVRELKVAQQECGSAPVMPQAQSAWLPASDSEGNSAVAFYSRELMSNWTCVLTQLGMLHSNLHINMDYWTKDQWSQQLLEPVDWDFRLRMIRHYVDCYKKTSPSTADDSDGSPGSSLPSALQQHLHFVGCSKAAETELCLKQELLRWLLDWYTESELSRMSGQVLIQGLDKFDRAAWLVKGLEMSKSSLHKTITNLIFDL